MPPRPPRQFDLFAPARAEATASPPRPLAEEAPPAPGDRRGAPPPPPRAAPPPPPSAAPNAALQQPPTPRIFTVGELVRQAGSTLEARFPEVWVEGEISNLKGSPHAYFTLKDGEAQLPAVMFRGALQRLRFHLQDGLKVRARGRLSIYPASGKFQLIAEGLEPAGLGALQLAFEQLKRRLAAEGLFAGERKRPLPFLPRCLGVVTSPRGAAVRDILREARRRSPVPILISPCLVQGDGAPADIVRALELLARQPEVEVIIVGRGGGSVEDLAAFNDEQLARAIARCPVPVISAIGHEVDVTIADLVADRRAATPTQAATLALPDHRELARQHEGLVERLHKATRRRLAEGRQDLDGALLQGANLLHRSISRRRRRLDQEKQRLVALHPRHRLGEYRRQLDALKGRLGRPMGELLGRAGRQLEGLAGRLDAAMQQEVARRRGALALASGRLDAMSPLRVLERGYSLVRRPGGEVVTRAAALRPGEAIEVRLARGRLGARVETVDDGEGAP